MTIERLDQEIQLPLDIPSILSGDPIRLAAYMRELVQELQQYKIFDIHQRVNLLLDRMPGDIIYLGGKDANGNYPDGTWRIDASTTDDYQIQIKESDSWVTKYTVTTDGMIKAGGFGMQEISVTTAYTVANGVYSIYAHGITAFSITLPSLTGQRSLRVYIAEGSEDITAVGTVNEETNLVMCAGETWDFVDNGTTWTV